MTLYYKLPRLYVESLNDQIVTLSKEQSHYLNNVMRLSKEDQFRAFNANLGEYLFTVSGKQEAKCGKKIAESWSEARKMHLYVPPLPKERMHFMIEKATELGITSYTPLITERAQIRKINKDKIRAWMIEAVEQSERFDIPDIHDPMDLLTALDTARGQKLAAIERVERIDNIISRDKEVSVFIGPAGGWTETEVDMLSHQATPIDLGQAILRSETAVIKALSII